MKRIFVLTVGVLAIVFAMSLLAAGPFHSVARAADKPNSVEQEILKLEDKWLAAVKDGKPEDATALFAENAVFTDADGTFMNKADELNSMNKVKWETADESDIKVIEHGTTVIVTGAFQGKGKSDQGKKVEVSERWTDVWMKTPHNGWQVVASQNSPVKK
jgi:ketosteroid isomerase-like protein